MPSFHIFFCSSGNESIKELNLSHNKFREEGGKQIGQSLGMYAFASSLPKCFRPKGFVKCNGYHEVMSTKIGWIFNILSFTAI